MMWLKHWLLALLGMTLIWGMAPPLAASSTPTHVTIPHVIRFRVIANSDNPLDQAVKLDVRDRILETLDPALNGLKNPREAAARIRALEPELSAEANQVLADNHVAYRARVEWTRTLFPTKAYGSWVLPAGRYRALLIVLGQGAGHNWWCVLFPSLCFIDMGNALAVPTSTAVASPQHPVARQARRRIPRKTIPTPPTKATPPRKPPVPRLHPEGGRIHVEWTTPRFFTTFLAILRG